MIPKFRAWDKKTKTMYEVKSIVFTLQSMLCVNKKALHPERTLYLDDDDTILMQSTGLLDKNGKEIFEGDIVRVTDGDERTDFSDGGIGTVCGLDDLYMWYIDGQVNNGLFDISEQYYIEVIGNIHEYPDLLESEEVE